MKYHRITQEERRLIYFWRLEQIRICEIARRLRRSPSTISREIKRNTGKKGYRYQQAHRFACERAHRDVPRRFTPEMQELVCAGLRAKMTPEMISGRLRYEGYPMVCKETIYGFIYADAKRGGTLWQHLPRAKRQRKRRCPRLDGRGRGRIPNQRSIEQRPAEVNERLSVGHWEGDLINGAPGTGHLVTLVERKTRFTLVGYVKTKEAAVVSEKVIELLGPPPSGVVESLTLDNGKEFAFHQKIERETGALVYFAHPYHSWERGTNENTNGLIRRLFPKGSSFGEFGVAELSEIERFLNDRPRKCLGWMTPREAMKAFVDQHD